MRAVWSRDARVLTVQVALPFVDRVEGVGLGAVATLAVVLGRQLLQHRLSAERTNVTSHVQRRVRNLRTAERTFVKREFKHGKPSPYLVIERLGAEIVVQLHFLCSRELLQS